MLHADAGSFSYAAISRVVPADTLPPTDLMMGRVPLAGWRVGANGSARGPTLLINEDKTSIIAWIVLA